ncbi:MAG: TonB-dependent receptor [Phenylobacterium sp.]|uniref:TonB-dependent receptor plug domain-containing protein n=1 Tax=Phenylobacterium sp. TaxID=1871053 RepID=UPI001B4BB4FC|nr:TonB-dependent receptor [Phenylobacterium sp.]MBP7817935.1 TonB-dependent receptor [Phenylobacterium sp.]MBP9754000.1 TonB-dependent receptor [Phenylobacterium sp.]
MKTYLHATAALAVFCASPALADDDRALAPVAPTPDAAGAEAANPVSELIVTAARGPQERAKVGQSVTVLTAADIEASQQLLVSDLVSRTVGVAYSRNGGPGGVTTLRIRGAEGDQTVAVVDGVKINDPSAPGGGYNFANLLTGDVARIEILRGAQSTLWGSQAIGGVINIVTAEPTSALEGGLQAEVGTQNSAYVRGAAGGISDHLVWRLSASHDQTDGVSAVAGGAEDDGYRSTAVSGRARVIASGALSLDLRAVYTDSRNDFDGFPAPAYLFADTGQYAEIEELVAYAGLNVALLEGRFRNRLAFGYTNSDSLNYDPAQAVTPVTFDSTGRNRRWEYQGSLEIAPAWTATFGAEREQASFRTRSPSAFAPNPPTATAKAGIDSLYAQVRGDLGDHLSVTVGLRRDRHDTFGDHTLGQVSAAWSVGDATVLRASFGQGFKAPTLYQLYSSYGNLGLKPEQADAWDAGVEHTVGDGWLVVAATAFGRETQNQIDFVSCAFGSLTPLCNPGGVARFGYYDNTAKTAAHGVELVAAVERGPFSLDANYTWTHTENRSAGANLGKQLARRPEHQANLAATYQWGFGLSTTADIRHVGASSDNAAGSYTLQSHTLLDLRAAYPVNDTLEVYGRVENVFDDRYETVRNYGTPGRAATLGVRARF